MKTSRLLSVGCPVFYRYRAEVESTGVRLRESVRPRNTHGSMAIKGLDLKLLTWAQTHARLMNRITAGDIVNDAIELYRTAVEQSSESLGGPSAIQNLL